MHNVQLAMQKKEAGIDAVADSIDLGYGFGYGYEYGYEYGQGGGLQCSARRTFHIIPQPRPLRSEHFHFSLFAVFSSYLLLSVQTL